MILKKKLKILHFKENFTKKTSQATGFLLAETNKKIKS